MHHCAFKPSIKVTFGDDDYGDVDITINIFIDDYNQAALADC